MAIFASVVSTDTYRSRVMGSFKGMLCGVFAFVAGIGILVSNEGNYVKQQKALAEGIKSVKEAAAMPLDSANEGNLVHLVGDALTSEEVNDPLFGVTVSNGLKLKRSVEMFQWVEKKSSQTSKNSGGSSTTKTDYSYNKEWTSKAISSDSFHFPKGHTNPSDMTFSASQYVADSIVLGDFSLSRLLVDKMNWFAPVSSSSLHVSSIEDQTIRDKATLYGHGFYIGESSSFPKIGDSRVSFDAVLEQTISVVACQTAGALTSFKSSTGGTVLLVEPGIRTAGEMFQHANEGLAAQTWFFRMVAFLCLFFSFKKLTMPLEVLADFIPAFGDIIGSGGTFVSCSIAGVVYLIVFAVAWLVYRPTISLLIVAALGGLCYFLLKRKNQNGDHTFSPLSSDIQLTEERYKDLPAGI